MSLEKSLAEFFYSRTLNELRLMNSNKLYPNISYNGLLYLDLISYTENCTVSYLAKMLHISKSAVTMRVNELIEHGWVTKTQSETDKRVFYLSVTKELEEDYYEYDLSLTRIIRKVEKNYTEEEIKMFSQMLGDIREEYLKDERE